LFGLNNPSLSSRVPMGWNTPSPNSISRHLGLGPRLGNTSNGMEQIRKDEQRDDGSGSPSMTMLDLDTDLLMGSPQLGEDTSGQSTGSPNELLETLRGSPNELNGKGRRYKRARVSNLRSKNRQKHNEAEMRRRRKLNESFDELAQACGTAQAQKATVLKTAIFQIQSLEKHIHVTNLRVKALKRLNSEDPLRQAPQTPQTDGKDVEILDPTVKKEEFTMNAPDTSNLQTDLDYKHTTDEAFRNIGGTSSPSLPEMKSEMDLQAQLGLAWKDIHDLVEYKNRTSQIISNVLQLAQLHINHQSIFSSSIVLEVLCAADGKIIDCNHVFCNFFGYQRDQAIQLTFYQITHPDSLANTYSLVQSLLSGSTQLQQAMHKFKTADGRTVNCQVTIWLATSEGRDPYLRIILEPAGNERRKEKERREIKAPTRMGSPRSTTVGNGRRLSAPLLGPGSSSPLLRVRRSIADATPSSTTETTTTQTAATNNQSPRTLLDTDLPPCPMEER